MVTTTVGAAVTLDATGTRDPDGHSCSTGGSSIRKRGRVFPGNPCPAAVLGRSVAAAFPARVGFLLVLPAVRATRRPE